MANTQLIIVLRKDLKFSPGLLAAQATHASDGFMRDRILKKRNFAQHELEWMKTPYVAVLAVQGLEELEIIRTEATDAGLQVHEWHDVILSPTLGRKIRAFVGISIGPDDSDRIAMITSQMKRY